MNVFRITPPPLLDMMIIHPRVHSRSIPHFPFRHISGERQFGTKVFVQRNNVIIRPISNHNLEI